MTDDRTPLWQKPAVRAVRIVFGVAILAAGLALSSPGIDAIAEGKKHPDGGIVIIMGLVFLIPSVVLVLTGLGTVISALRTKNRTSPAIEDDSL